MATLGPQIVSQSYGNLLKFIDIGDDGVETGQIRISDGKGKVTPLYLATGSVLVDSEFTASAEVVFSGLTSNAPGQYVSFDISNGRLYYSATSSIQNVVSASYAVSASFAPDDGDWIIGSSYMTASGQTSVYIPNRLENGLRNKAVGLQSHAEGVDTIADGNYSHAEGRNVSSSGTWSHAEGNETKAQQNYSHAEGDGTVSYGLGAHAEGYQTLASGTYSHAEGSSTLAKSLGSHAEGRLTTASAFYAHAEGKGGVASGEISHAEGHYTVASGFFAHSEGDKTLASNTGAHSEGRYTTASGAYSHAEGQSTEAMGVASHAEGDRTTATGDYSHAEGSQTNAVNDYSHAEGFGNVTYNKGQTVAGRWNEATSVTQGQDDVFAVGVGNAPFQRKTGLQVNEAGSVIMQQQSLVTNGTIGPPLYLPQWPSSIVTTGIKGLYFGTPGSGVSHRISSHPMIDNTGTVVNSIMAFSGDTLSNPGMYVPFAYAEQSGNYIVFNS